MNHVKKLKTQILSKKKDFCNCQIKACIMRLHFQESITWRRKIRYRYSKFSTVKQYLMPGAAPGVSKDGCPVQKFLSFHPSSEK